MKEKYYRAVELQAIFNIKENVQCVFVFDKTRSKRNSTISCAIVFMASEKKKLKLECTSGPRNKN